MKNMKHMLFLMFSVLISISITSKAEVTPLGTPLFNVDPGTMGMAIAADPGLIAFGEARNMVVHNETTNAAGTYRKVVEFDIDPVPGRIVNVHVHMIIKVQTDGHTTIKGTVTPEAVSPGRTLINIRSVGGVTYYSEDVRNGFKAPTPEFSEMFIAGHMSVVKTNMILLAQEIAFAQMMGYGYK